MQIRISPLRILEPFKGTLSQLFRQTLESLSPTPKKSLNPKLEAPNFKPLLFSVPLFRRFGR